MIGFSIELKRWYVVLRGPKGRVYFAMGCAKQLPVITPVGCFTVEEFLKRQANTSFDLAALVSDGTNVYRL